MLEPSGAARKILDAAIRLLDERGSDSSARPLNDEDVRDALEVQYPPGVVREALVDLGADWLYVEPIAIDGKVVRVKVHGVERRPQT